MKRRNPKNVISRLGTAAQLTVLLVCGPLTLNSTAYSQQSPNAVEPTGPLVKLSLTVLDSPDDSFESVKKENLRVIENKVEQKILSVEIDQRPTDIAIVIDASASFKEFLPYAIEAARHVIVNRRPTDEVFIERFISTKTIEKIQDFTTDTEALLKSLSLIRVEGGQSAVADAIYVAGQHLAEHESDEDHRKALVIITDGEDRNSYYKSSQVTKLLQENSIQVFALAITAGLDQESGFKRSPRERAEGFLNKVASETGGRVFSVRSPKELSNWTSQLIRNLQTPLLLSYRSSNDDSKKGFRKVQVKVIFSGDKKLKLVASPGYFFPLKTHMPGTSK